MLNLLLYIFQWHIIIRMWMFQDYLRISEYSLILDLKLEQICLGVKRHVHLLVWLISYFFGHLIENYFLKQFNYNHNFRFFFVGFFCMLERQKLSYKNMLVQCLQMLKRQNASRIIGFENFKIYSLLQFHPKSEKIL